LFKSTIIDFHQLSPTAVHVTGNYIFSNLAQPRPAKTKNYVPKCRVAQ